MDLNDLGYDDRHGALRKQLKLEGYEIGRVIAEHRERYILKTHQEEYEAEITGNLRFSATGREDFPAVGDWVAFSAYDSNYGIIHRILPRHSVIKRRAVGNFGEVQMIAANVDFAFLIQAVDRDFSVNRLERYLTICRASGVSPIIVLTKTDLTDGRRRDEIVESIRARIGDVPVLPVSNATQEGYESLKKFIEKGKTYCLMGSSGVGKSTLLNNLLGKTIMKTGAISTATDRGRHITSHRELVVLDSGGILIDNPGMREVGIAETADGVDSAFGTIAQLSKNCRFKDCTHTGEAGCAVLGALDDGSLDRGAYDNYLKIEKERAYFETSAAERKKKEKILGKVLKDYFKKDVKGKRL
jgi:ribosome biogenesis GTPase / thiamine phosphate phosphatase